MAKDKTKPDGDACRPDGTLRDASEMEWPQSPSDSVHSNLREGLRLKRKLPINDDESAGL